MSNNYEGSGISLKGSGSYLKLVVSETLSAEKVWHELERIVEEAGGLLANAGLIVDFGERSVDYYFLSGFIRDFVIKYNLKINSWISKNEDTLNLLGKLALKSSQAAGPSVRMNKTEMKTLVLKNSLRSGQRIEHHGDVIVIGHVNDGAEILATGNISVCGKLKGLVHAGYDTGEDNVITCYSFEAKQVRLGRKLSTLQNTKSELWNKPVIISLEKDSLLMREIEI